MSHCQETRRQASKLVGRIISAAENRFLEVTHHLSLLTAVSVPEVRQSTKT